MFVEVRQQQRRGLWESGRGIAEEAMVVVSWGLCRVEEERLL